jgi:glycosyltransferase involved in cell wall biosynthesis
VVLEALACGRPVVATDVGGIPDLLVSETLGQLIPVRDTSALELALIRTLAVSHDPSQIAALGCHGTWDDSARRLHASLQRAAER